MRTDSPWENRIGDYIEMTHPTGWDILINGSNHYLNWGTVNGNLGYGIRDNSGTMQFKNNNGSWANFGVGGSSVSWRTENIMAEVEVRLYGTPDISHYVPAYLTGSNTATTNMATWNAVIYNDPFSLGGQFSITVNGVQQDCSGLDFSACANMNDVATTIQGCLTGVLVMWDTDHFVFSSTDVSASSDISVVSDYPVGGVNISGSGATPFLACSTGLGTVTPKAGPSDFPLQVGETLTQISSNATAVIDTAYANGHVDISNITGTWVVGQSAVGNVSHSLLTALPSLPLYVFLPSYTPVAITAIADQGLTPIPIQMSGTGITSPGVARYHPAMGDIEVSDNGNIATINVDYAG